MAGALRAALAALLLLLSTLAAPTGATLAATSPLFDPEYVSPPPAEVSYLSLEELAAPLAGSALKLGVTVHALESGPFALGWWVRYTGGWEAVWWSPWFSGPGLTPLNASRSLKAGYRSFGHPLFVARESGAAWIQSVDVYGLDAACAPTIEGPSVWEVSVSESKDLGGVVVHVFLRAPRAHSVVRVRVLRGGWVVYEFSKTVRMPEEWARSPCVSLRVDFGPIRFKREGAYLVQVDAVSGEWSGGTAVEVAYPLAPLRVPKLTERQSPACTYHHLLLIYPNTNVAYLKGGVPHRFNGSMSESLKAAIISAFKNFIELVEYGSAGMVKSTYDIVEVQRPITRISSLGDGRYWLSPQDIEEDLRVYAPKGKYDSVHVVWYSGPIDVYFGLGGVFINDGTATFSSIVAGREDWWKRGGTYWGEVFLHEWLHGVCRFYESLGYPMPEGDADGGERHGYVESPAMGWMPYYSDLMQGKVWEPKLSRYTGITREAWSRGTPRGLLNATLDAAGKRILISLPEPAGSFGRTVFFIPDELLASFNASMGKLFFAIDGREARPLAARAANGYTLTFAYPRGARTIEIVLETYELRVRVLDRAGNPIPDALLNLTGPVNRTATTDRGGTATIAGLIPGTYNLSLLLRASAIFTATIPVSSSLDLTLSIDAESLCGELAAAYNELKAKYDALRVAHESLRRDFWKLASDYENLKSVLVAYVALSAVALTTFSALYIGERRARARGREPAEG